MRFSPFLATATALLLAACSNTVEQPQAEEGAERVACAVGGEADLTKDCLVERVEDDGRQLLVIRHADGSFRRFEQLDDGRGLQVFDGQEQAGQKIVDGKLEISVEGDRYLFPARISNSATTSAN